MRLIRRTITLSLQSPEEEFRSLTIRFRRAEEPQLALVTLAFRHRNRIIRFRHQLTILILPQDSHRSEDISECQVRVRMPSRAQRFL